MIRGPRQFRRRNALALHDLHYGPNMTPMVDVVMVILVFFMTSSVLLGPEWFLSSAIPVVKPGAAAPPSELLTLRILLRREGESTSARIGADGEPMSLQALDTQLAASTDERGSANVTVLVIPQADVAYEDVVHVHETCQRLGVSRVGILDPEPTPP